MTTIVVNAALVTDAVRVSVNKTPDAAIEEALRLFIAQKQQMQIREFRGKGGSVTYSSGSGWVTFVDD
jgi:electron transfer flavoprotein alpha/beta subunit